MMRTVDKTKFVTMTPGQDVADVKDFALHTHKDFGKPKLQTAFSRRKHSELNDAEKSGPHWGHK
jgi:hypothetical protein